MCTNYADSRPAKLAKSVGSDRISESAQTVNRTIRSARRLRAVTLSQNLCKLGSSQTLADFRRLSQTFPDSRRLMCANSADSEKICASRGALPPSHDFPATLIFAKKLKSPALTLLIRLATEVRSSHHDDVFVTHGNVVISLELRCVMQ